MAKGKDIAGLAALGTLAYMMGRKQGASPSTSSGDNKPPVTTVTPAAVAPPKPVEDDRYLERDIGKERSAMQRPASVAAAPAPVSAPAPAAPAPSGDVTKPISTRPGTMGAYVPRRAPAPVSAPAPAKYRPAVDANAASNAMASRDIYPERASTRDAAADAARRARMAAAVTQGIGRGQSTEGMKRGGAVKGYANGGSVSSRADGIAQRGKTNCKIC